MNKKTTGLLLLCAILTSGHAVGASDSMENALARCRAITSPIERLDCYDGIAKNCAAPVQIAQAPDGGKWVRSVSISPMDDAKIVTIGLAAENTVSGWPDTKTTPTLIIRANCQQNSAELYVVTGMAPHVENAHDTYTATVRFGSEPAIAIDNMSKSTDGKALFFSSIAAPSYIKIMERNEKMLFQFTPFNSNPALIEFDVRGLSQQLQEYRKACKEQ